MQEARQKLATRTLIITLTVVGTITAVISLFYFIYVVRAIVLDLVIALVIAAALHPLVAFLSKKGLGVITASVISILSSQADMLLSGHMHVGQNKLVHRLHLGRNYSAVQVQAGTATSLRYRGEPNAFNVIVVDRQKVEITQFVWNSDKGQFDSSASESFQRKL